jgi:hypothetical protein
MTHDAWSPGVHCRHCGRKVAEGSAHVDEDGNLWDAHWDCARRAELERRARDAGPSASERSLRGRIGAYTRWANTEDRYMATRPAREGFYAKFEREVHGGIDRMFPPRSHRNDAILRQIIWGEWLQ